MASNFLILVGNTSWSQRIIHCDTEDCYYTVYIGQPHSVFGAHRRGRSRDGRVNKESGYHSRPGELTEHS